MAVCCKQFMAKGANLLVPHLDIRCLKLLRLNFLQNPEQARFLLVNGDQPAEMLRTLADLFDSSHLTILARRRTKIKV